MRLFYYVIWWKNQMKSLQRNVASLFAALFFLGCTSYVASLCDPLYFTTWALYLHCAVFAFFATLRAAEMCVTVKEETAHKTTRDAYLWLFSPAFSTAVCVLATSVYLLIGGWEEAYSEYCLPDETQLDKENSCLDFALEFVITHAGPPVLLALFAFIDRGTVSLKEKKSSKFSVVQKDVALYGGHVFLTTALLPLMYGLLEDIETVYGNVSELVSTSIFVVVNVLASLSCAFYFTLT